MKNIFTILKTVLVGLVLVCTAAGAPIQVQKAEAYAGWPVGIVYDVDVIKPALNSAVWIAAKAVVAAITQSIVNWINSGFQGSPGFVTNLQSALLQVSDEIAAEIFGAIITEGDPDSPFVHSVAEGLLIGYYAYTDPDGMMDRLRSTLIDRVEDEQEFLEGDFGQGGLSAWFHATQRCTNNPYGAMLCTQDEFSRRAGRLVDQRLRELDWGKGFMSWRGSCAVTAPGEDGTDLGPGSSCLEYNIETPGSVVENQLVHVLGSNVRQLELADSINEIVGALLGQLVQQIISPGGLAGASEPGENGRALTDMLTDPVEFEEGVSPILAGVNQQLSVAETATVTFQEGWATIGGAAEAAKNRLEQCDSDEANQMITDSVNPVIEHANQAITRANTALESINGLRDAANETTVEDIIESNGNIGVQYEELVAAGIPSQEEIDEADFESSDTGTGTEVSIYTVMTRIATGECP